MTKTQELLEAVRLSMGDATNYALSKTLDIHAQTIKRMLKTRRPEGRFFLAVGLTHARRKSRHRASKNTWHGDR